MSSTAVQPGRFPLRSPKVYLDQQTGNSRQIQFGLKVKFLRNFVPSRLVRQAPVGPKGRSAAAQVSPCLLIAGIAKLISLGNHKFGDCKKHFFAMPQLALIFDRKIKLH
jgi:hypothetical protein